jgi:hypothetical protein
MVRRLGLLLTAATAAAVLTLGGSGTASADPWFTLRGYYPTASACDAAGKAGYDLWGPVYSCVLDPNGYYGLYTH